MIEPRDPISNIVKEQEVNTVVAEPLSPTIIDREPTEEKDTVEGVGHLGWRAVNHSSKAEQAREILIRMARAIEVRMATTVRTAVATMRMARAIAMRMATTMRRP